MVTRIQIKNRTYFVKPSIAKMKESKSSNISPAIYITYDSFDKNWSVYKSSLKWNFYNKDWFEGNYWNLFGNLSKVNAIKAAVSSLNYMN